MTIDPSPLPRSAAPAEALLPGVAAGAFGVVPDDELTQAVSEAELVGSARRRRAGGSADRCTADRRSAVLIGGSFLVVAAAWLLLQWPGHWPWGLVALCLAAHAVASSVEFEIGPGSAVPSTPVLVVSLLLCPPPAVPWVALGGTSLAGWVASRRDPARRESLLVQACSAWHALGPALVFAWWPLQPGPGQGAGPGLTLGRVAAPLAVALGAQVALDLGSSWLRNCWGLGLATRQLLDAYRFTVPVDLLLAPVGLAAALAAGRSGWALALVMGPVALLAMLARDRRRFVDRTLMLSEAYTLSAEGARTDVLTKLANRLAWEEQLAQWQAGPGPVGVILADVDGLKRANDTFGHDVGDRLLATVARVLAAGCPTGHGVLLARLGGDEFGVLLPGDRAATTAEVAADLAEALRATPDLDGPVPVSASLGWAVATAGHELPARLRDADTAVNRDKLARGVRRG